MRNQISSSPKHAQPGEAETPSGAAFRPTTRRIHAGNRAKFLAAGAVVAVGALVGSGFVLQSAVAAQNERIAATTQLTEAADLDVEQLGTHAGILEAHAVKQAEDTLAVAEDTISAAQGKADPQELAATIAALGDYKLLAPERVFELVDQTAAEQADVKAAIDAHDKAEAEKAAAAKAAAEKAAAEAAAAADAADSSASTSYPSGPANPTEAQATARDLMASMYGWGGDQFGCLVDLWNRESGWNVYAQNPSGAYGIPQALPGDKMATAGADWATSAATQIKWGLGYIAGRYGNPCGAWSHSESAGWY